MGRKAFAKNHDIDLENDMFTAQEFLQITKNDYGGSTIRKTIEKVQTVSH